MQQVFKAGKLIFTTAAAMSPNQTDEDLPFAQVCDGTIPFNIEEVMQGDILIRCRHLTSKNQRVSMFRAAFHTGYVPPNVLRLTKSQLDGACGDERYADDFFVDLIFEKVDAETATKYLEEQQEEEENAEEKTGNETKKGKGPIIKASSVDTMLHGDSRFWDIISERKKEQVKQRSDAMRGPTVGRRRGESQMKDQADDSGGQASPTKQQKAQIESFSIGTNHDFDFFVEETVSESVKEEPKKDSLQEALNALDDDDQTNLDNAADPGGKATKDTEEINFGTDTPAAASKSLSEGEFNVAATNNVEQKEGNVSITFNNKDNVEQDESEEQNQIDGLVGDDDLDDMDALLTSLDASLLEDDIDLADFDVDDDLDDLENMLKS